MPKVIQHGFSQLAHRGWAALVLFLACLFGFIVSYPTGAQWLSNAAQAEVANAVIQTPETISVAKKPVRYEAIIDNWKRYREANPSRQ